MVISIMDRIKQLDEEKAKLIGDAKREAIAKVEAAIAELNSLGFNYRLQEVGSSLTKISGGTTRKGAGRVNSEKPCPICDFQTDPPHDARRHRSQAGSKRPFTNDELAALDMQRVNSSE